MNHSQQQTPGPVGFGFARNSEPVAVQPGPPSLSEADCIVAASVLQEVSALQGQPDLNPIAYRLRQCADQARLGSPGVTEGASAEPPVAGAVAREELRIKALWEGRLQVFNLGTRLLLIVLLAWVTWENRGLRAEIRQAQEAIEFLADAFLRLAEGLRSDK